MGLLEVLIIVLLVLWLAGAVTLGPQAHLILVIVVVVVIVRLVQGRSTL